MERNCDPKVIEIRDYQLDIKKHDLGGIYQANGFDNPQNKSVELQYFKSLLEQEKSKINDIISSI